MGSPVFIIAEAGINHGGNIDTALKMVEVAASAKVDAIKFQSFTASELASKKHAPEQYEFFKRFEMSDEQHKLLADECKSAGIEFMSTPFDFSKVDLLDKLGVNRFKIASCDLTNIPLIEYAASKKKPMFISTGMGSMEEADTAYRAALNAGSPEVFMLHCTTLYPTPYSAANLNAICTMDEVFHGHTGFSDHTVGNYTCFAAVALGAKVIEKHFTLNKNMSGPDIPGSCSPSSLNDLVRGIRAIEKALGTGSKMAANGEDAVKDIARRSIFAAVDISRGTNIIQQLLSFRRPGTGIPPTDIGKVIGKTAKTDIKADSPIKWEDIS